jgi:hypothetical protein
MFTFNISTKEISHSEISEWFSARNAVFTMIYVHDVKDWMNNYSYQIFDIEVPDELVAVEFRLAFDATIGESQYLVQHNIEQELMAILSDKIAKEMDEAFLKEILATTTNYLDTLNLAKLYGQ